MCRRPGDLAQQDDHVRRFAAARSSRGKTGIDKKRNWRHRLSIWLMGLAVLQAPVLAPMAAADSQRLADQVLSDPRYQTTLPDAAPSHMPPAAKTTPTPDPDSKPGQADGSGAASGQGAPPDAAPPELPPVSPPPAKTPSDITIALLKLVPGILLGAVLIALLVFFLRAYRRRRRATVPDEVRPVLPRSATPGPIAPGPAVLSEWQRLADQGRFTEAIHVLFLHLLAQLGRDRVLMPASSQTSREILHMDNLPTERRPGLATIIGAVEFCHFGGRPAGAQLFQHCVDAYEQVVTVPPRDAPAKRDLHAK